MELVCYCNYCCSVVVTAIKERKWKINVYISRSVNYLMHTRPQLMIQNYTHRRCRARGWNKDNYSE